MMLVRHLDLLDKLLYEEEKGYYLYYAKAIALYSIKNYSFDKHVHRVELMLINIEWNFPFARSFSILLMYLNHENK